MIIGQRIGEKMKLIQGQYNTAKVFATTIEASCEQQIREKRFDT